MRTLSSSDKSFLEISRRTSGSPTYERKPKSLVCIDGYLGPTLQYFDKRLADRSGRVGDSQDRRKSWSHIHRRDFPENSLTLYSRRHENDWDELVVAPRRTVAGSNR
jgi:hypothetical protein